MDRFQELLNQLSVIIHTPLYLEKNRAVKFSVNENLHIQIEDDEQNERIFLATFIGEIPPGKYRENLLKEGLKANALFPRTGTLSYAPRNNQLTLFEYLYYASLTGEKIANRLAPFIEKALFWKQAMERGTLPSSAEPDIRVDHRDFGMIR